MNSEKCFICGRALPISSSVEVRCVECGAEYKVMDNCVVPIVYNSDKEQAK